LRRWDQSHRLAYDQIAFIADQFYVSPLKRWTMQPMQSTFASA